MTRLILVRHGRAAGGWTDDHDPGLHPDGQRQAAAMAADVARLGPLPIVVSPLRRTRETARPLEVAWATTARVEPGVGEIPSPIADLTGRGPWLATVMRSHYSELSDDLQAWRADVVRALTAIPDDAVVVSHYIAINVAVGAATGDDRVVTFSPAYCSRTVVDVADGELTVVELGAEGQTLVR